MVFSSSTWEQTGGPSNFLSLSMCIYTYIYITRTHVYNGQKCWNAMVCHTSVLHRQGKATLAARGDPPSLSAKNTITYALFRLRHTHARTHVHPHVCMCLRTCIHDLITTVQKHHEWWRNNNKTLWRRHSKKILLTVKIVGVTNAQQTLQNLLGWNPIIISISSQNLCNPVNSKRKCN